MLKITQQVTFYHAGTVPFTICVFHSRHARRRLRSNDVVNCHRSCEGFTERPLHGTDDMRVSLSSKETFLLWSFTTVVLVCSSPLFLRFEIIPFLTLFISHRYRKQSTIFHWCCPTKAMQLPSFHGTLFFAITPCTSTARNFWSSKK